MTAVMGKWCEEMVPFVGPARSLESFFLLDLRPAEVSERELLGGLLRLEAVQTAHFAFRRGGEARGSARARVAALARAFRPVALFFRCDSVGQNRVVNGAKRRRTMDRPRRAG